MVWNYTFWSPSKKKVSTVDKLTESFEDELLQLIEKILQYVVKHVMKHQNIKWDVLLQPTYNPNILPLV